MAGRRGAPKMKTGIDSSTMVYVSMAVVLIVLAASLYTFGLDFGFFHIGGTPNVNILYAGAAVSVLLSYAVDIKYIKAHNGFFKKKETILSYIPYVNFISILNKNERLLAWILMGGIAVIALPAYTPLGRFMPVDYLMLMSSSSIYIVLAIMALYSIIRGWHCSEFKKRVDKVYKKKISSEFGSGGSGFTLASHIIYYLPIIRLISLFTDLNFINTVALEIREMRRKEERK